jgi:hypothetical protein
MTADDVRVYKIVGGHKLRLRAIALALRGPPLQLNAEASRHFLDRADNDSFTP